MGWRAREHVGTTKTRTVAPVPQERSPGRGLVTNADLRHVPVHAKTETGGVDPALVREAAGDGLRTPATALPHQSALQRSFGKHDLSAVKAHTGAEAARAARRMGAHAFTAGDRVVFGGAPTLETAAHEAAHAIQHRSGKVAPGAVGRSGDREEIHAEAVAANVLRGQSSESLLDAYVGTPGPARVSSNPAVNRDETPSRRYSDGLAAKDWTAMVLALADMETEEIDKRARKLEIDELDTMITIATRKKKTAVAKRLERRKRIKLFNLAIEREKYAQAAKHANKLELDDLVYLYGQLEPKQREKIEKQAKEHDYKNVLKAIKVRGIRAKKAKLEAITNDPDASFGEVAAAYAKIADVSHDLKIAETGRGLYEGNKLDGVQDDKAKSTDCTEIVLEILENTFKKQGKSADWKKVKSAMRANTKLRGGGGMSGIDLQAALQSELGWKGIFWAPDPDFQIPKDELAGHTHGIKPAEAASAHKAAKKGSYYKNTGGTKFPGVSIDETVVDYAPESATDGTKSKTKKKTAMLKKLQKLPFGVMSAHGALHMTVITLGKVIEVHWDLPSNDVNVIQQSPIETWAVGESSGYHYFASGAIVAPAEDVDKAFGND